MDTPVRITPNPRLAGEWALVLTAQGVDAAVERAREGYALCVDASDAERATSILALYESENPSRPVPEAEPDHPSAFAVAFGAMSALLFFFLTTGGRHASPRLFERASADAERILEGELWRSVTALTLHADLGHALGNALAGTLFLTFLGRSVGPGLALALALVAGAVGNLATAALHQSAHSAVGASTSVFGAIGLLGGRAVVGRQRIGARGPRRWAPLAGGLALLAMLGVGPRADLSAHLLGLVAGAGLGVLAALTLPRPPPSALQWLLGAAALGVVLHAWALALA